MCLEREGLRIMKKGFLNNKEFVKLWFGSIVSNLGDSMDNIVFMMLAIKLTKSPSATGLMMMIISIPNFVFSVFGGAIADIFRKKRIMFIINLIDGLLILLLLILLTIGKLSFLYLCIILFLVKSLARFYNPAYMASVANVVKKEEFLQARSFASSTQSIVEIIGPSIVSILLTVGYIIPLGFDAFSFILAAFMVFITKIPKEEGNGMQVKDVLSTKFLIVIKEGFSYLRMNSVLLKVFMLIFFTNFFLGFFEVALPFFVKQSLMMPFSYYGYLKAIAAGMAIFAGLFIVKSKVKRPGKVSVIAVLIMGTSMILFGFSSKFWLASIFWIIAAFFRCISVLMLNSFYGLVVEAKYRGRIIGISTMIYTSIIPISFGLAGVILEHIGAKWIFIASGIGLFIVGVFYSFNKELVEFEIG